MNYLQMFYFSLHKNPKNLTFSSLSLICSHSSSSTSSLSPLSLSPMANNEDDSPELTESQTQDEEEDQQSPNADKEIDSDASSQQSSDDGYYISGSDNEAEEEDTGFLNYVKPSDVEPDLNADPETNIRRLNRLLQGKRMKRLEEEDDSNYTFFEDLYDFPKDPEHWKEEDLREIWADAPLEMKKPGWDPVWADEEDWEIVNDEIQEGRDPGIQPFYVPYRKPYPAIPDNHYDIDNPKAVVEELDRIEEFLQWVSYIFADGSS